MIGTVGELDRQRATLCAPVALPPLDNGVDGRGCLPCVGSMGMEAEAELTSTTQAWGCSCLSVLSWPISQSLCPASVSSQ